MRRLPPQSAQTIKPRADTKQAWKNRGAEGLHGSQEKRRARDCEVCDGSRFPSRGATCRAASCGACTSVANVRAGNAGRGCCAVRFFSTRARMRGAVHRRDHSRSTSRKRKVATCAAACETRATCKKCPLLVRPSAPITPRRAIAPSPRSRHGHDCRVCPDQQMTSYRFMPQAWQVLHAPPAPRCGQRCGRQWPGSSVTD